MASTFEQFRGDKSPHNRRSLHVRFEITPYIARIIASMNGPYDLTIIIQTRHKTYLNKKYQVDEAVVKPGGETPI